MTIFDRFKMSDFLLKKKDGLSGPIELFDEDELFVFFVSLYFAFWQRLV